MTKIAVVTDTDSSLPIEITEKYHITMVPIPIQFGDKTFITGKDIDDEKLFEMIDAQKALPTTAAPSPNAYQMAFQSAFEDGADQIICVCCSREVSMIYDAATLAAQAFPGKDISIIDSKQLCLAQGFQALYSAEGASRGEEKDEILARLEDLRKRIHVYAALPTLKYLAMGGRVGKLAAGFADTLDIKPILTSVNGKLELLEKVRTWRKARERLLDLARECTKGKTVQKLGLIHVNNEEGAVQLGEMLAEVFSLPEDIITAEFTPGLSVHTGTGVIGFVLITD
jgi:DegV family protein with EDD domain